MSWLALLVALCACGSTPAPPAKAPVAPAALAVAPVTCHDAGVILRGSAENEENGESIERGLEQLCLDQKWPPAVLECVGSQVEPITCLDKLPPADKAAFDHARGPQTAPPEPGDFLD